MAGELPDVAGGEVITSAFTNAVKDRTLMRYDNAATRDAAIPAPVNGDFAYLVTPGGGGPPIITIFDGVVWRTVFMADGQLPMSGALLVPFGSAGAPSVSFDGDTVTGMYRHAVNAIGFATNGAIALRLDSAGNAVVSGLVFAGNGSASAPAHTFASDSDTGMYRAGTNQLGFARNGIRALHLSTTHANFGIGTTGMPTAYTGGAGTALLPAWSFTGDTDTGMYRAAANGLSFATGGGERMHIGSAGQIYMQDVPATTTGTAANMNIGTSSPGQVRRSTSARKYKTNIVSAAPLKDLTLDPVTFHRDDDDDDFIGFIADDMPDDRMIDYADGEVENYDLRAVVAILAAKVNDLTERLTSIEGTA